MTGYYFIHFSQGVVQGQSDVWMSLVIGENKDSIALFRNSSSHNGIDMLSRSGLIRLEAGDILKIRLNNGCYSDSMMQTSFMGFFLYAV